MAKRNGIYFVFGILILGAIIAFFIFTPDQNEGGFGISAEPAAELSIIQGDIPTNNSDRTLSLPYGDYEGDITNGYPDGDGRLVYRIRTRIAQRDSMLYADPGQYVEGTWRHGELLRGNLYDASGNLLGDYEYGLYED